MQDACIEGFRAATECGINVTVVHEFLQFGAQSPCSRQSLGCTKRRFLRTFPHAGCVRRNIPGGGRVWNKRDRCA